MRTVGQDNSQTGLLLGLWSLQLIELTKLHRVNDSEEIESRCRIACK
jgi:hypothetical protein